MTPVRLPAPPEALKTRLLTVGPVPPEWGGRLRGGVTRFNVTLLDELRTRPWRHRIEPVGVLIPPPQRIRRRVAERDPIGPLPTRCDNRVAGCDRPQAPGIGNPRRASGRTRRG